MTFRNVPWRYKVAFGCFAVAYGNYRMRMHQVLLNFFSTAWVWTNSKRKSQSTRGPCSRVSQIGLAPASRSISETTSACGGQFIAYSGDSPKNAEDVWLSRKRTFRRDRQHLCWRGVQSYLQLPSGLGADFLGGASRRSRFWETVVGTTWHPVGRGHVFELADDRSTTEIHVPAVVALGTNARSLFAHRLRGCPRAFGR